MNKKIIKILVWFLLMVSIVLLGEKAIYAKTAVPIVATSISHSTSFTYTGKEIKPIVSIKYNGKTLKNGNDYILSYSNNINTGKGNITIKGKGDYTGTVTRTFSINRKSITTATVTLTSNSCTYSGAAMTPSVGVKLGTKVLKKNTDYTVAYSNNINAGTAKVIINGKGNYTGTIIKTFTINKKNISGFNAILSDTSYYKYSGETKKPEITVKWGTTTLRKNVDYIVSYSNNINAGTAKVIIKGKGNYTGTITKTFKIYSRNISDSLFFVTLTYDWKGMSIEEFKEKTSDGHFEIKDGKMTAQYLVAPARGDSIYIPKGATNFSSIYLVSLSDVAIDDEFRIGVDYEINYSKVNENMVITITGKGNYTGTKKIMCIAN